MCHKILRRVVGIVFCALTILSCKKEAPTMPKRTAVITGEVESVTAFSATVSGTFITVSSMRSVDKLIIYSTKPDPTWNDSIHSSTIRDDSVQTASFELTGLEPGTTYFYRSVIIYADGSFSDKEIYGEVKAFTTVSMDEILQTGTPTLGVTNVILRGSLESVGDNLDLFDEVGFVFSKTPDAEVIKSEGLRYIAPIQEDGSFESLVNMLEYSDYYYMPYVYSKTKFYFGKMGSFHPVSFSPSEGELIDMGLFVKWGSCNVGASKPEETGDYFAWGETSPKDSYDESNYTPAFGYPELLPLSADAAHVNLGGDWRMPTSWEYKELIDNSIVEWGTYNSMGGSLFISKITNNRIFLPAAGTRSGNMVSETGDICFYWTCSTGNDFFAQGKGCSMHNYSYGTGCFLFNSPAYYGASVRGVCE